LRAFLENRRLALALFLLPVFTDELIDGWHENNAIER
jgi:hypothetical protein